MLLLLFVEATAVKHDVASEDGRERAAETLERKGSARHIQVALGLLRSRQRIRGRRRRRRASSSSSSSATIRSSRDKSTSGRSSTSGCGCGGGVCKDCGGKRSVRGKGVEVFARAKVLREGARDARVLGGLVHLPAGGPARRGAVR